jgi:hypothetical protein
MSKVHPAVQAALIFFVLCLMMAVKPCEAQDVTYCKNYQTGQIIVVEAGMPCPYPTVQL